MLSLVHQDAASNQVLQAPQQQVQVSQQQSATASAQAPQTSQQQSATASTRVPQTGQQSAAASAQTSRQDQNIDVIQGLVNLLREEVKQSHLPALELNVFYGDVTQFELRLKSFETYIENKTSSPIERLHYLGKYTEGEAKAAILGYIQLRTEDTYQEAKNRLMDRYGNEFVRASAYKRRIRSWPMIKSGDGKALREFADFLQQCDAMSRASAHLKVLDDQHENSYMLKKLPRPVVDRWRRYVDQRLYEPQDGESAGYPLFKEFVKFVAKEARVACGPVEDPANKEEKDLVRRDRRVVRALQTAAAPSVREGYRAAVSSGCVVCSNLSDVSVTAAHPVTECGKFLKMSLKERQAAVMKYGLCRGCLRRGHVW